jgi:hypothetical protein
MTKERDSATDKPCEEDGQHWIDTVFVKLSDKGKQAVIRKAEELLYAQTQHQEAQQ